MRWDEEQGRAIVAFCVVVIILWWLIGHGLPR